MKPFICVSTKLEQNIQVRYTLQHPQYRCYPIFGTSMAGAKESLTHHNWYYALTRNTFEKKVQQYIYNTGSTTKEVPQRLLSTRHFWVLVTVYKKMVGATCNLPYRLLCPNMYNLFCLTGSNTQHLIPSLKIHLSFEPSFTPINFRQIIPSSE